MTLPTSRLPVACRCVARAGLATMLAATAAHAQVLGDWSRADRQAWTAVRFGRSAGLGVLGDTTFAAGDLEVRLWRFGYETSAYVLRRVGGAWRVLVVRVTSTLYPTASQPVAYAYSVRPVAVSDSVAAAVWARCEAAGVDTLVDDPERLAPGDGSSFLSATDDESVVLEVRRGARYHSAGFPDAVINAAPGAPARRAMELVREVEKVVTRRPR